MTDLSTERWLLAPATQKVMKALLSAGKEARFIGGCVRDALYYRPVNDIDIATQEKPDKVIELLENHHIKAVPTGIDHGTITAVCEGKVFEITTLRSDVRTDGRHAVVAFSEDWLEDARRRDFTFNAMSMDLEGNLYDPFDGLSDLKAGRVRFVGDAYKRIKEDYLRLLRFFRFSAYYSKGQIDPAALEACRELAEGLNGLSGERVSQEFLKLLAAPRPAKWISLMIKTGVLAHLIKNVTDPTCLEMLCAFEDKPDSLRRLAVLLSTEKEDVCAVAKRFRLSNAQKKRLLGARCNEETLTPGVPVEVLRSFLYRYGAQTAKDHVFIYWAEKGFTGVGPKEQNFLKEIDEWSNNPRQFPLQGKDLLAIGYKAGPELGCKLKTAREKWFESGCEATKEELLAQLPS